MASPVTRARLALAIVLIPTIAYVVHDLVLQLPDNEGEASPMFFITIAGLLCVWASSGYLIARRFSATGSRIVAGAVTACASVGLLWLAFIVLNQIFLERMSYEPDRIWAFRHSGYPTLRAWWSHQHGWGPFPLLGSIAAAVGAVGGGIGRVKAVRSR